MYNITMYLFTMLPRVPYIVLTFSLVSLQDPVSPVHHSLQRVWKRTMCSKCLLVYLSATTSARCHATPTCTLMFMNRLYHICRHGLFIS